MKHFLADFQEGSYIRLLQYSVQVIFIVPYLSQMPGRHMLKVTDVLFTNVPARCVFRIGRHFVVVRQDLVRVFANSARPSEAASSKDTLLY